MLGPRKVAWIALTTLCLFTLGCKSLVKAIVERVEGSKSEVKAAQQVRPATAAEAAEFSKQLQQALVTHRLPTLLSTQLMAERAAAELDLPDAQTTKAVESLLDTFSASLERSLKDGGTYKLLGNRMIDGQRRIKFRLIQSNGAFNYNDYIVVNHAGKVRAIDIYVLLTGEFVTQSLRRALLPLAADANKSIVERLTERESVYVQNLDKISKLAKFQDDPKGALEIYQQLPEVLKRDKNVLTIRVQAASLTDDDQAYLAAMEDYRSTFPKDPSVQVISIDFFILEGRNQEAIDALTKLEKLSGPDAHLNTMRAGIYAKMGNLKAARRETSAGFALEPDLPELVNLAIALDLAAGDEPAALAKVEDARRRKVDLSGVEQNPGYAAFMAKQGQAATKALHTPPP